MDCAVADAVRVDAATGGVIVVGAGGEVAAPEAGGAADADAAPGAALDFVLTHSRSRTFGGRGEAAWSRGGCLP